MDKLSLGFGFLLFISAPEIYSRWYSATNNHTVAIILVGLQLVLGVIAGVTGGVGTLLQKDAVDYLYKAIKRILSGYRRTYDQHMIYDHRNFDVKGLSTQGIHTLELEHVWYSHMIAWSCDSLRCLLFRRSSASFRWYVRRWNNLEGHEFLNDPDMIG